jgi:cytochrome c
MYVLQYGANYFARNPDASLVRIEYAEGNRQPIAKISAAKTVGAAPFKVKLSAKESFDYDKEDELTYAWQSGAGEKSTNTEPVFTYSKPGEYRAQLTVTDKEGEEATTEMVIRVGNDMPEVAIELAGNRSFYSDNRTLAYKVKVQDKEDGKLQSGISPEQVRFHIDYLEGKDMALLSSHDQSADGGSVRFLQGKALVAGSDCSSCHALDKKSIGPSWLDVANRYQDDKKAVPMLARKIITGGSGNWGKNMMSAHPQHTEEETAEMTKYILSLGEGGQAGLPLEGTYTLQDHKSGGEGTYVITASYTDKGDKFTGPLTGRRMIRLRSPRVQAEDFDSFHNVGRQGPWEDGTSIVSNIRDGSYISFKGIDLSGIDQLTFRIASVRQPVVVEVRAGSPTGKLIGKTTISPSANKEAGWRTIKADIQNPGGVNELFFVFRNKEVKDKDLLNLDWIYFGADQGMATK